MLKFIKSVAAISLLCGASFSANAGNESEITVNSDGRRQVMVSYGDLDLTTAEGKDALSERVRSAVRKVCDANGNNRLTIWGVKQQRDCFSEASKNALASLDKETRARMAMAF